VAALYWVGKMVVDSVNAVQNGELVLHVSLGWLFLSAVLVLATNVLLILSWLHIVAGLSGKSIRFLDGARIWFISNLGTLLPGRVWGIAQMSAMSAEAGIDPVAAAAASIINTALNIATGMAVGVVIGAPLIASYFGELAWLAWIVAALAAAAVLALPLIVPWGFRALSRVGLHVPEVVTPPKVIGIAAVANVASWFLYGVALLCLNRGVVDPAARSVIQHTAAYATSYVMGYMVLIAPAGLGAREYSLTAMMQAAGLSTLPQATALSVVSRLWTLTMMVLPALIFLAYRRPSNEKGPPSAAG
jgi:glycosyltransferase 2 family protein